MTQRVGVQRRVLGDEWMLGKEYQDREWDSVRQEFDRFLAEHGLTLKGEAKEETHYDEERRAVMLRRSGYTT